MKVRSSVDFSLGNRNAGAALVAGTIMGTLIGGSSTVGTAQMAFMYGFSAWWFTLGGGIACLVIGLFLVKPMRETCLETVPQFIGVEYGQTAGVLAAVNISLGLFISVIPQVFSALAIIRPIFALSDGMATLLLVILMASYVISGGLWGTGIMGICKTVLIFLSLCIGGGLAFYLFGGLVGLANHFPPYPWLSLFGQGSSTSIASLFSLLAGVLSSQIYYKAIFSGLNLAAARGGVLISAALCPLIGAGGDFYRSLHAY